MVNSMRIPNIYVSQNTKERRSLKGKTANQRNVGTGKSRLPKFLFQLFSFLYQIKFLWISGKLLITQMIFKNPIRLIKFLFEVIVILRQLQLEFNLIIRRNHKHLTAESTKTFSVNHE